MEWVTLIGTFLLPLLARCQQATSTEDPREYLKAHYDPATDTFDDDLVDDCLPQTARAIRMARKKVSREERRNFPRYSREEMRQITIKNLHDSLKADDSTLAAVMATVASMPELE